MTGNTQYLLSYLMGNTMVQFLEQRSKQWDGTTTEISDRKNNKTKKKSAGDELCQALSDVQIVVYLGSLAASRISKLAVGLW